MPKSKSTSKTHAPQRYRSEWERSIPNARIWLQPSRNSDSKAWCKLCSVELAANVVHLKEHSKGKRHASLEAAKTTNSSDVMSNFLQAGRPQANNKVKEAEVRLCAMFAAHNLSFRLMDHMLPTLKLCFPDSQICQSMQMKQHKCRNIVKSAIGATQKEDVAELLKQQKFSVLTDESTDLTAKTVCIVVRLYSPDEGRIVSRFFDLRDVFPKGKTGIEVAQQGATGAHLFELLMKAFEERNIPTKNIMGFGCDSASVNIGSENSVWSRLRVRCPGITLMKCICHSMHRAASAAAACLPRDCEELAKNVYNFVSHSAKRQSQYLEFQMFTEEKELKILRCVTTRWLSLSAVVARLLSQWGSLTLFFTHIISSSERNSAAEQIHHSLKNPWTKMYFQFLAYVLPKVTSMNAYFQTTQVVVTSLHAKMEVAFKEILCTYMEESYVSRCDVSDLQPDNSSHYKRLENIYLGAELMQRFQTKDITDDKEHANVFRQRCRNFLITLGKGIKERFEFGSPLLKGIEVLAPGKASSLVERECTPSLVPLCELASPAMPDDLQGLDDEWRRLPFEIPDELKEEKEADVFWHKVSKLTDSDGRQSYRVLPRFSLAVLSLPHANADCERIFSQLNLVKSKARNKLKTSTVEGALLASEAVKSGKQCCFKYNPSRQVMGKLNSAVLYADSGNENSSDSE